MSFTKQNKVSAVNIQLKYVFHKDEETGELIKFEFPFRRQRNGEADEDRAALSAGQMTDLDRFSKLLVSEPLGFNDFPADERPLSDRAKEYFGDDDLEYFVTDALHYYGEVVSPRAFFLPA